MKKLIVLLFITIASHSSAQLGAIDYWLNSWERTKALIGTNGQVFTVVSGVPHWSNASTFAWGLNGNSNGVEKYIGTNDNYDLPVNTNSVEIARFTASGRVGIGTSSPISLLDVYGATSPQAWIRGGASAYLNVNSAAEGSQIQLAAESGFNRLMLALPTYKSFYFSTSGSGGSTFSKVNTEDGNWYFSTPNSYDNVYSAVYEAKVTINGVDTLPAHKALLVNSVGVTGNHYPILSITNGGNIGVDAAPTTTSIIHINLSRVPGPYANNAAAIGAGLVVGDVYYDTSGHLTIVY